MTHSTYELIAQTITDSHTVKELKAITDSRELEVTSSSTHSYSKLKEDYVSAVTSLLVEYNHVLGRLVWQHDVIYKIVSYVPSCTDEIINIFVNEEV